MSWRLALGISILWIPLAFLFDGTTALLLPVKLADQPGAASAIGLISFAGLGAALLVQPLAGELSDRLRYRLDRRLFLAIAAIPVLAGLWLLAGAVTLIPIAIGYLVVQVAASSVQAAQQTLIAEHVDRHARGQAGGLKTAFDLGGAFLAFLLLGGLLASGATLPAAAMIGAVLILALALVFALVPRLQDGVTRGVRHASRGLPPGFRSLVLARFLFLLGAYAIYRFLLLLIAERLGIDPAQSAGQTGLFLAFFSLATVVAAVPFGMLADRIGHVPTMRVGVVLSAIGIAAFLLPAGLPGVIGAGMLMSVGTAAFVAANWAALTQLVTADDAGRLMGIANFGTGGAAACAGLLGPLIDVAGFTPALALAGLATLLALAPLSATIPTAKVEPI